MRGLYHRLAPFTPDSVGACAVFADLPALVIPVDMNGTVSTFRRRVNVDEGSPVRICSMINGRELTYTLGEDAAFLDAFCEIVDTQEGDFVVLVQGPVSSLVGLDLNGIAEQLEQRVLKPVLSVECSGSKFYDAGITQALHVVFERAKQMTPHILKPQPGAYNVCGLNSVDHNDRRLRWMLSEMLLDYAGEDGRAISYWGSFGGWQEWCYAAAAEKNIVVSVSGVKLAREMQRTWNTPFEYIDDLDLCWCSDDIAASLYQSVQNHHILIVGEQLMANVVRNVLLGVHDQQSNIDLDDDAVTVGCFFDTVAAKRRSHDIRFASERDCADVLASNKFDVVIGDEALRSMLPPETIWYDLPHSAIATLLPSDYDSVPIALSNDWFAGLAWVLRGADERSFW